MKTIRFNYNSTNHNSDFWGTVKANGGKFLTYAACVANQEVIHNQLAVVPEEVAEELISYYSTLPGWGDEGDHPLVCHDGGIPKDLIEDYAWGFAGMNDFEFEQVSIQHNISNGSIVGYTMTLPNGKTERAGIAL